MTDRNRPVVCSSPAGGLWLLLENGVITSVWLNLETAEVRQMDRAMPWLLNWGWRVVEGDASWRAT